MAYVFLLLCSEFSQQVYVFFGIASVSTIHSSSLPNQDPVKCLERYALARARNLVLTTYKLFGAPPEDIKCRVLELADMMPFLYGNGSKEDWTELGDPVLIETTIIIVFGNSQPGITTVVLFYSYEPPQVAAALAAVCTLTDSMDCVQYSPFSTFTDLDCSPGVQRRLLHVLWLLINRCLGQEIVPGKVDPFPQAET